LGEIFTGKSSTEAQLSSKRKTWICFIVSCFYSTSKIDFLSNNSSIFAFSKPLEHRWPYYISFHQLLSLYETSYLSKKSSWSKKLCLLLSHLKKIWQLLFQSQRFQQGSTPVDFHYIIACVYKIKNWKKTFYMYLVGFFFIFGNFSMLLGLCSFSPYIRVHGAVRFAHTIQHWEQLVLRSNSTASGTILGKQIWGKYAMQFIDYLRVTRTVYPVYWDTKGKGVWVRNGAKEESGECILPSPPLLFPIVCCSQISHFPR